MSATVRTALYGLALAKGHAEGRAAILLVEMVYVTLTAGLYAGMQQRALELRSQLAGNLLVAVGIPGLSQLLDGAVHRGVGAAAPVRALVVSCLFTIVSALFHLYVMRRGAFLTGKGRSLGEDFRRMPFLIYDLGKAIVVMVQNIAQFMVQTWRTLLPQRAV